MDVILFGVLGSDWYHGVILTLLALEVAELVRRRLRKPRHRREPHRELRALAVRGESAAGKPMRMHSTVSCAPAAGPERGSAVAESSVEPQPAPGSPLLPGAGPQHRATTAHTVRAHPTAGCGGPAQLPVDVTHPDDVTSTGVQPRNSGGMKGYEPGASEPSPGAPVRPLAAS